MTSDQETARTVHLETNNYAPWIDGDTIHLLGGGPECPGCGGPTHAVTGADDATRPWWCQRCNVRLDDDGDYGAQAHFPADTGVDDAE